VLVTASTTASGKENGPIRLPLCQRQPDIADDVRFATIGESNPELWSVAPPEIEQGGWPAKGIVPCGKDRPETESNVEGELHARREGG